MLSSADTEVSKDLHYPLNKLVYQKEEKETIDNIKIQLTESSNDLVQSRNITQRSKSLDNYSDFSASYVR